MAYNDSLSVLCLDFVGRELGRAWLGDPPTFHGVKVTESAGESEGPLMAETLVGMV